MFKTTNIDHVGVNTNDMEATVQFYCGILGMKIARTMRTPSGGRHYNVEIGGGNAFAFFETDEDLSKTGNQYLNPLRYPGRHRGGVQRSAATAEGQRRRSYRCHRKALGQDLLLQRPERHKAADRGPDQGGRTGPHGRPPAGALGGEIYEVTGQRGQGFVGNRSAASKSPLDPRCTGHPGDFFVQASPEEGRLVLNQIRIGRDKGDGVCVWRLGQ